MLSIRLRDDDELSREDWGMHKATHMGKGPAEEMKNLQPDLITRALMRKTDHAHAFIYMTRQKLQYSGYLVPRSGK